MGFFYQKTVTPENVVILTFDRPDRRQNIFSVTVLRELDDELNLLLQDRSFRGVVFATGKEDFTFGADVTELQKLTRYDEAFESTRGMQELFLKVSKLSIPSVIALKGTVIGAGVELATSCSWRLCSSDKKTRISLPEIHLGFVPSAGATHRLPRLIGIKNALDMMLSGRFIKPQEALKMGLVDCLVSEDELLSEAVKYALIPRKEGNYPSRPKLTFSRTATRWIVDRNPLGRSILKKIISSQTQRKTHGHYPAFEKTIETTFENYGEKQPAAFLREAKAFADLMETPVSKNLFYLFMAKKGLDKKIEALPLIETIGIVGEGRLRAEMLEVCLRKGLEVVPADANSDVLVVVGENQAQLAQNFRKAPPPKKGDPLIVLLGPVLSFQDILKGSSEKKMVGMPTWSSLKDTALWEMILFSQSSKETTNWAKAFCRRLGKAALFGSDGTPFFLPRLKGHFLSEALHCLQDGARIENVDRALLEMGFTSAPLASIHEMGWPAANELFQSIPLPSGFTRNDFLHGAASLFYPKDKKRNAVNLKSYQLFSGREEKQISSDEIANRCFKRVVKEARKAVADSGGALSATEADVAAVLGMGFPAYLGGPLRFSELLKPTVN